MEKETRAMSCQETVYDKVWCGMSATTKKALLTWVFNEWFTNAAKHNILVQSDYLKRTNRKYFVMCKLVILTILDNKLIGI